MPITCTRVMALQNASYLCCGDFVGRLTLIDLQDFVVYAQVNAHSRFITDICLLEYGARFMQGTPS